MKCRKAEGWKARHFLAPRRQLCLISVNQIILSFSNDVVLQGLAKPRWTDVHTWYTKLSRARGGGGGVGSHLHTELAQVSSWTLSF